MRIARHYLFLPLIGSVLPQLVSAQSATDQVGRKLYVEHIRPILEQQCQPCHNGTSKQGGLDVSTREGLMHGGGRGASLVPGNSKGSLLYKLVTHHEQPYMPVGSKKLPAETAALLALWIDLGAPDEASAASATVMPTSMPATGGDPLFEKVRPVLEAKCFTCHGGKFKQAGFDMSTREKLLRGSDGHKDVVVPGNAAASLLIKKLRHTHEPGMPFQGEKLPEEVIASIAAWIDAKAPYSGEIRLRSGGEQKAFLHGSDHWAYQPPKRPAVPKAASAAWVRNPIDSFIAAEHAKRKFDPVPEADKRTLLRRVYLDLIGMPPLRIR